MTVLVHDEDFLLLQGDARSELRKLADESIDCVVTSPPYFRLRDYGTDMQIGLEDHPEHYVSNMVKVFRELWRILKPRGTAWLNLGDTYHGGGNYRGVNSEETLSAKQRSNGGARGVSKKLGSIGKLDGIQAKSLFGMPWRVAFALQECGWLIRSDIIWHKPNAMPESVTDRPTKAHEYLFLLTKQGDYFFDQEAVREPAAWERWGNQTVRKPQPGAASWIEDRPKAELERDSRNIRSVWSIPTANYPDAHFAVFPETLVWRCILAGCPDGGVVLDPFIGSGTTAFVARSLGRKAVGIELNPDYCKQAMTRNAQQTIFAEGAA